jgi:hypothetical protein
MNGIFLIKNILPIILSIIFTTCDNNDIPLIINDDYTYEDTAGNLVIVNSSNSELYIFNGINFIREIPLGSGEFLINIETDGNSATDLRIWKKQDVDNLNNPSNDSLYKRWVVVLSNSLLEGDQVRWIINDNQVNTTGTVYFNYPNSSNDSINNIYSVDVHIQSMNGAKIASISPGTDGKQVGLGYDYYQLYFHYWFSNNTSDDGKTYVDWYEQDYPFVLNTALDTHVVNVPIIADINHIDKGSIYLENNLTEIVMLYLNGQAIEYVVVGMDNSEGISYLNPSNGYTFDIPIGTYNLEILHPTTLISLYDNFEIDIIVNKTFNLDINSSNEYNDLLFINNTNIDIALYDYSSDGYLGRIIDANSNETVKFLNNYSGLYAQNIIDEKVFYIYPLNQTNIISPDQFIDYDLNQLFQTNFSFIHGNLFSLPVNFVFIENTIFKMNVNQGNCSRLWDFGNEYNIEYQSYEDSIYVNYYYPKNYNVNFTLNCENISTTIDTILHIPTPNINLLAPNGGEIYQIDQSIELNWESNFDIYEIQFVTIYYQVDDYNDNFIETSLNDGVYFWSPPLDFTSDSIKIKIKMLLDDNIYEDLSDDYFSIIQ